MEESACRSLTVIMMFASIGWAKSITYAADEELTNVLINGGFEDSEEDGRLPGWQPDEDTAVITVSESVYAEGERSLQVERLSPAAGSGVVSDAYTAQPFGNVIMTASVLSDEGQGGKADLRFYDAGGKLVSVVSGLVGETSGKWQNLRVAASAPKNATEVRVAFGFNGDLTGRYFVDSVSLESQASSPYLTNLGPQSSSLTLMTAAFGKDRNGQDALFTVAQGDPAQFIVMDVASKEVKSTHPLVALDGSNVSAAWAIVTASDGKVYIGSTPNGTLFQYDPAEDKLRAIGKPVPTDTVIWTLVAGEDGKVYGGTGYSQSLFEYDPVTDQTRILKSFKTSSKEAHIRSLAYDSDRQMIYVGEQTSLSFINTILLAARRLCFIILNLSARLRFTISSMQEVNCSCAWIPDRLCSCMIPIQLAGSLTIILPIMHEDFHRYRLTARRYSTPITKPFQVACSNGLSIHTT